MTDTTADLTWSDEPPEEPGWYWHKSPATEGPSVICIEERAIPTKNSDVIARKPNGQYADLSDAGFNASQWAGPIPEPDEPSE